MLLPLLFVYLCLCQCEFVADYISSHAHSLLLELQQSICSCLGCCDTASSDMTDEGEHSQCYFPNREHAWMDSLIERVTKKVSREMYEERMHEQTKRKERRMTKETAATAGAPAGLESHDTYRVKQDNRMFLHPSSSPPLYPPSKTVL